MVQLHVAFEIFNDNLNGSGISYIRYKEHIGHIEHKYGTITYSFEIFNDNLNGSGISDIRYQNLLTI